MAEYHLDLEGFDDEMAAEEHELNDDQDKDMTLELASADGSEGETKVAGHEHEGDEGKSFLHGGSHTAFEVEEWLEILGEVGGLLYGESNVGTLHSVHLGPRECEFSISILLQR